MGQFRVGQTFFTSVLLVVHVFSLFSSIGWVVKSMFFSVFLPGQRKKALINFYIGTEESQVRKRKPIGFELGAILLFIATSSQLLTRCHRVLDTNFHLVYFQGLNLRWLPKSNKKIWSGERKGVEEERALDALLYLGNVFLGSDYTF